MGGIINAKLLLSRLLQATTSLLFPPKIVYAGTEGVSDLKKQAIASINGAAAITGLMVFVFGLTFYALMPTNRILIPVILEGAAFWFLIVLNKWRKYNAARLGMYVIHSFSAIYFGATLGEALPIELVAAFLFVFLVGASCLVYQDWRSRIFCFMATLLLYAAVQANYFLNIIEPIHFPPTVRLIVKLGCVFGIIVLMAYVTFSNISSNDKAIKEKEEARRQLEEANFYISKFMEEISHEVRVPLNAIYTNAQLLSFKKSVLKDIDDSGETWKEIKHIYISSGIAKEIINNVLDFGKIKAGKYAEPRRETVDLKELVEHSVSMNSIIAATRQVSIFFNFPPDLRKIYSDGLMLLKVIGNLLSNAAKFATPHTCIDFDVYVKNECIYFRVKNAGGISKEKAQQIFERFESERNHIFDGTGLGLAIAKELVALLGGSIWVDGNENITSFTFTIPFEPSNEEIVKDDPQYLKLDFSGKKVLLLEDDRFNMLALAKLVEKTGATALCCDNVKESIAFLELEKPDLIISDVHLPDGNAKDLLALLKKDDSLKNIPLVVITGDGTMAEEMIQAGAAAYIMKPYSYKELYLHLSKYIGEVANFDMID